jgi:hypothetical protein
MSPDTKNSRQLKAWVVLRPANNERDAFAIAPTGQPEGQRPRWNCSPQATSGNVDRQSAVPNSNRIQNLYASFA